MQSIANMTPSVIETTMYYMANDSLYQIEKPYYVAYSVDDIPGAKRTNHIVESKRVSVKDIRGLPQFQLDEAGFTFVQAPTMLTQEQFLQPHAVRSTYFEEIQQMLKKAFPRYTDIVLLDYVVICASSILK